MSKKNQYEVQRFYGVPVEADANGTYQLKLDPHGEFKVHTWRTGKHTRGNSRGWTINADGKQLTGGDFKGGANGV